MFQWTLTCSTSAGSWRGLYRDFPIAQFSRKGDLLLVWLLSSLFHSSQYRWAVLQLLAVGIVLLFSRVSASWLITFLRVHLTHGKSYRFTMLGGRKRGCYNTVPIIIFDISLFPLSPHYPNRISHWIQLSGIGDNSETHFTSDSHGVCFPWLQERQYPPYLPLKEVRPGNALSHRGM